MNRSSSSATPAEGSLYAAHEKVYPREVSGRFASLRVLAVIGLLGVYYGLPWLRWDARQAILFDLPARKFYIFELVFWPQDFFYLAWLLIMAALSLFFFTALAGRLWCGYACPQTVWTQVYVWMEQLAEGKHSQRRKLDRGPWTGEKVLRKSAKQALWIGFSLATGFTFVGYFTPISELGQRLATLELGGWETFWVLFYSLATYGNAGFLREQICIYMCPYARFQSAMFDRDTLVISYDPERGEPRGGRRRGVDPRQRGLGDCIDCHLCVQVCPTGIDIREGLQYECIACAACIDACDQIMDKMSYPRGLIRYSTQRAIDKERTRVVRPRTVVYGVLLASLFGAFAVSLAGRTPLILDVIRDRNALYRELPGNEIENVYTLKILNMDTRAHTYRLSVEGLPGLRLDTEQQQPEVRVDAGAVHAMAARLRVSGDEVAGGGHDIVLRLQALDDERLGTEAKARFIAPLESP